MGRGVETQYGTSGDANMIVRYNARQERACRQTRPVDDNTLAGCAHLIERSQVGRNLAARIIDDSQIRRSRANYKQRAEDRRQCAGQDRLPFH